MRPEVTQAAELLRRKDPASVEQALHLLQHTVYAFSMKVCGHREDAEDTMQDVLLKSATRLPDIDNPKALAVWLYTVAKNHCLMTRRRSAFAPKQVLSLEDLMPNPAEIARLAEAAPDPEHSLLNTERGEMLRAAVQKVPPQYRLILVLHDMEQLSTDEVAKITGLRPGTVRVRLHRARLFVRNELSRHGAFGPVPSRKPHQDKPTVPAPARCKKLFAALSDYLDEQLDDTMCERMQQHIAGCQPCEAFLSTLEQTVADMRAYEPVSLDEAARLKLVKDLRRQYASVLSATDSQIGPRR